MNSPAWISIPVNGKTDLSELWKPGEDSRPHQSGTAAKIRRKLRTKVRSYLPDAGNEDFDREEIIRTRREATLRRMVEYGGTILAVQDTTGVTYMILCAQPDRVNLRSDSGNNELPESTVQEVKSLIRVLESHIKVVLDDNANRIMKE
jgi:hypothetical protein